MAKFPILDLISNMDPDKIRVHPPSSVVFLCGGLISQPGKPSEMLRDLFFNISKTSAPPYNIILAEDADPLTSDAGYKDLLSFESDVAQIVGLILLFVESAGSLAELGAFSALPTIAPNMLAVVNQYHYEQKSFVRRGPLLHLERTYGEDRVHQLDELEGGLNGKGEKVPVDPIRFSESILPAVASRLDARAKWAAFDRKSSGHAILLMSGLCQEFGALKESEIKQGLVDLGVEDVRVDNYLYCSQLLGWLRKVRKGNNIYFVATDLENAIDYQLRDNPITRSKVRWRAELRAHWRDHDKPRLRAIADVIGTR